MRITGGRGGRGAMAAVVGVVALLAGACGSGDPLADYLSDMRAAGTPTDVPDAALIVSGEAFCQGVRSGEISPDAAAGTEDPAAFEAAARHCESAFAQPLSAEQRSRYGVDAWLAQSAAPDPAAAEEQALPSPGEGFTERGNETAMIGEEIESWGPPMAPEPSQWVTVTSIEEHTGSCPAAAENRPVEPSENGSFYKVEMTVRTGAAYDVQQSGYYPGTAPQFDYVTESGTAFDEVNNLPAFYCSGEESSFYNLAPGRTYQGTVWVDLPDAPGFLILGQTPTTGVGYEFEVG